MSFHHNHPLDVLLPRNNGIYQDFPFQSLRMDRENQKQGPALWSKRTHFSFTTLFLYNPINFGPWTLLTFSHATKSFCLSLSLSLSLRNLSSLFTSTPTRQGDTSNTSDWSDNYRVLLLVVSQKLSLNFRGKETPTT